MEGKLEYAVMKSKGGQHSDVCDVFDYSKDFKCNFVKIGSDNITTSVFIDNNGWLYCSLYCLDHFKQLTHNYAS